MYMIRLRQANSWYFISYNQAAPLFVVFFKAAVLSLQYLIGSYSMLSHHNSQVIGNW